LLGNLLKACGVKTSKHSFHSLRHAFEDTCRTCEVPLEYVNATLEHTGSEADQYGSLGTRCCCWGSRWKGCLCWPLGQTNYANFGGATYNSRSRNSRAQIDQLRRSALIRPAAHFTVDAAVMLIRPLPGSSVGTHNKGDLQVRRVSSASGKAKRPVQDDCERVQSV
jgi:hypothetical protein